MRRTKVWEILLSKETCLRKECVSKGEGEISSQGLLASLGCEQQKVCAVPLKKHTHTHKQNQKLPLSPWSQAQSC